MKFLHLFNSLTDRMEIFKPIMDTDVKISLCKPITQESVSLQDARIHISLDIIRRILEGYFSYNLRFVLNILDIIIDKDVLEETRSKEHKFFEIMDKLNVKRADFSPRATDHVNVIKKFISDLSHFTYMSEGSVYFNLDTYKINFSYNILKKPLENETSGFVLWKKNNAGYSSDFGMGQPAFYVQCSALSSAFFDSTIDIKVGGVDLCFHHENEMALNQAQSGKKKTVTYFVNIGDLKVEPNTFTVSEILERFSPEALRLLFLQHHNWNCLMHFDEAALEKAQLTITNLFQTLLKIENFLLKKDDKTCVSKIEMDTFCKMKLAINEAFCRNISTSTAFETLMCYINYLDINLENLSLPIIRASFAYVKFILNLFGLIPINVSMKEKITYASSKKI